MIYLSDKGEVVGEFEETTAAEMLAAGKISNAAFFWREGMAEWRPVSELAVGNPKPAPAPAAQPAKNKPAVAVAAVKATPIAAQSAPVAVAPANPMIAAAGSKPFVPRRGAAPATAQAMPMRSTKDVVVGPPPAAAKSPRWLAWSVLALLLLAGAGGGAWWWIHREPPMIPGTVALAGTETSPVEVRIFRREDLAGPWRAKLAAADTRAAELEKMAVEAEAAHRAKKILYDEAAGVCAVGEEYNMPDVEELRADRDAKKGDADAAKAELEKLQAEKQTLLTMAGLLQELPAPVTTLAADAQGNFALPPPEGEVVLLATVASGGGGEPTAWLEVLEVAEDGTSPEAVRFAETNRLDLGAIRGFAGASSP